MIKKNKYEIYFFSKIITVESINVEQAKILSQAEMINNGLNHEVKDVQELK